MRFDLPNGVSFYYSYDTLVAFSSSWSGLVVHANTWSTTTGKHLNWIDGGSKKDRKDAESFELALADMLEHYGLQDDQKCLVCGDQMFTRIRGHHHHRADCKELHDCATDATCKGNEQ